MTASNYLYIIAIGLVMTGWGASVRAADGAAPASSSTGSSGALAPDGTPVVHKSLHKKRRSSASASNLMSEPIAAGLPTKASKSSTTVITVPKTGSTLTVTSKALPPATSSSLSPTVETGMPVARHTDLNGLTSMNTAPSSLQGSVSLLSTPGSGGYSTTVGNYSGANRPSTSNVNFAFTDFTSKRPKNNYPWKTNIITTMFYIGEGGSSLSPTTNLSSSWIAEWVAANHGPDSPNYRNGFASGGHASTVNPFYVALPFNDLVYPDKAREWLPPGWHRPNKDGKPVSACKDRWVEIKTEDGSGHVCYAQWEDVGPLRYDHAEYVFGPERPDTMTRAGLDVSPAVAQYLGIDEDRKAMTRWRFVDDEDVPPGQWLKLDEQAVIYSALHDKGFASPTLPIQRASEPIDDQSDLDDSKKKVGAAKG